MKKLIWILLFLFPLSTALGQTIEREKGVIFTNIAPGEEVDAELLKPMTAKITFSSESGTPYGGVFVRIFNSSGIAVLKHLCEKPLLFIKLPEGDYNIVAVDRKKVQRMAAFKVKKGNDRPTLVKLTWPKKIVGY